MDKIGHRPLGSGATTIHIVPRPDNPGFWLFIGRKLWQDIGSPDKVQIADVYTGQKKYWVIQRVYDHVHTHAYTVSNTENDGIPRLTIGKATLEDLGLGLYALEYPATIFKQSIHFRRPPQGLH